MTKIRFIKLDGAGSELPPDAEEWAAVLDSMQNLIWTRGDVYVPSYSDCEKAVESLQGTAGFSDWRMPTVEELFLLADRTRANPAIDTAFFSDCKSDWYWSSTPAAPSPGDYAWFVLFVSGFAVWLDHDYDGFVRAVRASQ